jgi:hypothetical protein
VSFATIILYAASQRVFIFVVVVVVYFVIDSVRKLLDTLCVCVCVCVCTRARVTDSVNINMKFYKQRNEGN